MSNNVKKILVVALLSTMGLVACNDNVQAKPGNYDEKIVSFTDSNDEIYHNLVSIIDDAYRDGSLSSAVLDKVLYQYSVSVFGRYNRIAKPDNLGENEITLKEAAADLETNSTTHEKADKFINDHKAYWSTDNEGNRITTPEGKESEYDRVSAKWNTIEDRISRIFYEAIKGGSYNTTRKYFDESKYLAELRSKLEKVADPYDEATPKTLEKDRIVITADVQEEDVFKNFGTVEDPKYYLHHDNYQDKRGYDLKNTDPIDADHPVKISYVEDSIIPQIYRTLLVEQYLLDESYNTLGRSYARKVNVLTISENSNNDKSANYLMKYFVRDYISTGKEVTTKVFKDFSNTYKGILNYKLSETETVGDRLNTINTQYAGAFPLSASGAYRVGTDYGDMMEKYEKIKADILTTDTSIESDFTGSYSYPKEVGLEIKTNEIETNDYTTDGWYIKNGGLTELPDTIKSRLFNIGVANVLDDNTYPDRYDGSYATEVPAKEGKLVAKINGKFYLKVASKQQSGSDIKDDILFYENGKYYVIQIEEAVSGSKLAKEDDNKKYTSEKKEEIINEVARVIGNNDTYQSASTKHWLEQAAIKYHDSKVYDYFKENYPDLFK